MTHTGQAVPLIDSEEAVGGDGDDGGCGQARLSVGHHVGHRRIRGELQHHDDVLLHLLCEHQRRLQEEILFSGPRRVDGQADGENDSRAEGFGKEGERERESEREKERGEKLVIKAGQKVQHTQSEVVQRAEI